MSALDPRVRVAVPMFLRSLTLIELGRDQPASILEHPKMMAITVLNLLDGGDDALVDVGDLSIASLARATITLCETPTDSGAVAAYQRAQDVWREVNEGLS